MRRAPHPDRTFIQAVSLLKLSSIIPLTRYESPKKPHVVSKNASKTEPAKLLVFLLSQEGESLVVPMK